MSRQIDTLTKAFNKRLLTRLRQPVKPTLKLSPEASATPLPKGWLSQIREILTRTGQWADLPTNSVERFVSVPGLGVDLEGMDPGVVGSGRPMFGSVGFGDMSFKTGFSCSWNTCDDQDLTGGDDDCDNNWCSDQSCEGFDCDANICPDQECDGLDCDGHVGIVADFVGEIEAYWEHPFVQELLDYFGVEDANDFRVAVSRYVGRNMCDMSEL